MYFVFSKHFVRLFFRWVSAPARVETKLVNYQIKKIILLILWMKNFPLTSHRSGDEPIKRCTSISLHQKSFFPSAQNQKKETINTSPKSARNQILKIRISCPTKWIFHRRIPQVPAGSSTKLPSATDTSRKSQWWDEMIKQNKKERKNETKPEKFCWPWW